MNEPDKSGQASVREVGGIVSLSQFVQGELRGSLDFVDLYQVAATLQLLHPDCSIDELAKQVAEVAVKSGFRRFAWEPPEG